MQDKKRSSLWLLALPLIAALLLGLLWHWQGSGKDPIHHAKASVLPLPPKLAPDLPGGFAFDRELAESTPVVMQGRTAMALDEAVVKMDSASQVMSVPHAVPAGPLDTFEEERQGAWALFGDSGRLSFMPRGKSGHFSLALKKERDEARLGGRDLLPDLKAGQRHIDISFHASLDTGVPHELRVVVIEMNDEGRDVETELGLMPIRKNAWENFSKKYSVVSAKRPKALRLMLYYPDHASKVLIDDFSMR